MRTDIGALGQMLAALIPRRRHDCRSIRIHHTSRGCRRVITRTTLSPPGAGDREPNRGGRDTPGPEPRAESAAERPSAASGNSVRLLRESALLKAFDNLRANSPPEARMKKSDRGIHGNSRRIRRHRQRALRAVVEVDPKQSAATPRPTTLECR